MIVADHVLELAGAAALLVPRLAGLAAAALTLLMVGAVVISALAFGVGPLLAVPGVVLVLVVVVALARRRELRDGPAFLRELAARG